MLDLNVIEASLATLKGSGTLLSVNNVASLETISALDKLGVESLVCIAILMLSLSEYFVQITNTDAAYVADAIAATLTSDRLESKLIL